MKTVVSSKGQIVIPSELRARDRILPGQKFDVERLAAGRYLLVKRSSRRNEGLVERLLECPEKGWFREIDSESTDTL